MPGVESASAVLLFLFPAAGRTADLFFPGRAEPPVRPAARFNVVLPGYLETLKIPLLEGRSFSEQDTAPNSAMSRLSTSSFVRKYFSRKTPSANWWPTMATETNSLSHCRCRRQRLEPRSGGSARPEIYIPELQHSELRDVPGRSIRRERKRCRGRSRCVSKYGHHPWPSSTSKPCPPGYSDSVKLRRFVAWLLNSFALVGLLLAALGLYGTLAYTVQLRRREIAIRMALGASPRDTRVLILRHCASIAAAGLVPGALISVAAARATRSFLFGISPLDPWTVALTAAGFFALALAPATWIPAMQATRVDALLALREE